jgi:predicted metal-dependent phosphoesterase TrpH
MTGPVRLDLHVHSDRSPDSELSLAEIVAAVRGAGLQGFALTDHNSVAGHAALRELAATCPDLTLVPGVEVSTADGHLLAFGVTAPPPPRRPCAETIDWVRAHGGEAVPAHPFRFTHGVGRRILGELNVRVVEGCNGQSSRRANRRAGEWAAARRLVTTGGSDAHTLGSIGRAWTELSTVPASTDAFLDMLRAGRPSGAGASVGLVGSLRWGLRNAGLRVRRGLRAI